ncbi:MAG: heme ABC exporter ATP-binding protein CcmA [Candidatus Solibacter usitatus]|nr:heme ABC exporter ATP-binding protein CcmA [Candidatus Solibacter usitatus]
MSAVAADGVWKYYGDFPALRAIRLSVEQGECLALLGRNGSGKTTLIRILAGLLGAQQGSVSIFGKDPRHSSAREAMGMLGHGIGVYDELSAYENLLLFANLYGVKNPGECAREWLQRTGLDHVASSLVREFSRGMRQRLAVARAFLHRPSLFLLDEPFTALDDRAIALLQGLLLEARERGATIIMSTHQLREAMELATKVALLNRGKLVFEGPRPAEMLQDPTWLYRQYGEG